MYNFIKIIQYSISIIVFSGFSILFLYNIFPLIQDPHIYSDRKEYIREEFLYIRPLPSSVKTSEHTIRKLTQISITTDYFTEASLTQIDEYYRSELSQLGWEETPTNEPNTLKFTKDRLIFIITRTKDSQGFYLHTGIFYDDILVI